MHVVIIGALPESLTNFRGDLIRAMVAAGHHVTAMAAPASAEQVSEIERTGAKFRAFDIERNGLNPLADLKTLRSLGLALRELAPDVVLAYTIKPVIWGGLALRLSSAGKRRPRFFALITGLGFAFEGRGVFRRTLTGVASNLYAGALKRASGVIFQNTDNRDTFLKLGIVDAGQCHVVDGSGVDTARFIPMPLPPLTAIDGVVFLTIARLLGEKGLREYVEAARKVKAQQRSATFHIVGPTDPSPDGIPLQELEAWQHEGVVNWHGPSRDVSAFIARCHVYVLPSYHEGMPRTVLEAMSMGRPILTTDVSGCRETVVAGVNGYLVPKADAPALAERMLWFIDHRDAWQKMGDASRALSVERFDVKKINSDMLGITGLVREGLHS